MCVRTDPGDLALDVTVVDCRAGHEEEVMARTELAGPEEWPGDQAIDDAMDAACDAVFASYTGIGYDDSRLEMDQWTVDEAGRPDGGRTLICLVLDPAEPLLDHALQSSRR